MGRERDRHREIRRQRQAGRERFTETEKGETLKQKHLQTGRERGKEQGFRKAPPPKETERRGQRERET